MYIVHVISMELRKGTYQELFINCFERNYYVDGIDAYFRKVTAIEPVKRNLFAYLVIVVFN